MSDKLEELKKQQEKIAQQIKLEELKKEQVSIEQQINDLTSAEGKTSAYTSPQSNSFKQETHKGKVITLEGSKYKVNGVIQKFSSIDDAKRYIDGIGTPFDLNRDRIKTNKNNDSPVLKFMLALGLGFAIFIIYAINWESPKASRTQFKIPDGSFYSCQNKNASQMLLQLTYSRTSPELASIISHIPTGRIEQVSTWLFYVPMDQGNETNYNYRNQKISSTNLTIYPKSSKVIFRGEAGRVEFVNCLMIGSNGN